MLSQSKIARLPRPLQIELNRRLQSGQSSTPILAWLNARPEVATLMRAEFDGALINKQNLSDWRSTGLAAWQSRQTDLTDILDLDSDATELDTATQGRLADRLATVLAGRYAKILKHWDGEPTEEFSQKLCVMHTMILDVSHLRGWDHSATRVRLIQAAQPVGEENEALFTKFEEWAQIIGVQDYLMKKYRTPRERENIKRELLCLPPLPDDAEPAPGPRVRDPQHVATPTTTENTESTAPFLHSSFPWSRGRHGDSFSGPPIVAEAE